MTTHAWDLEGDRCGASRAVGGHESDRGGPLCRCQRPVSERRFSILKRFACAEAWATFAGARAMQAAIAHCVERTQILLGLRQPQHRQGARHCYSADATRYCRRGDRIGRLFAAIAHGRFSNRPSGSSTFRLSTTPVSMSLAGSRFSSDSAPRPFHHGIRRRGGTIFWATLPSM